MSSTIYFLWSTLAAIICISSAATSIICPQECHCYSDDELSIVANCSNIQPLIKSLKVDKVPPIDKLYLSNANVKKINKNFEKLNLELLDLSYNKLQSVNNLPKHIETLILRNNDLIFLDASSMPPLVEELDLSFNRILELRSEVMTLSNLNSIKLEGNRLRCTCETLKMRDYFKRLDIITDKVTCITKSHSEVPWEEVKITDACHNSKLGKVPIGAFDDEDEMFGDDPFAGSEGSGEVSATDGVEPDFIPVENSITTSTPRPFSNDEDEGSGDEVDGVKPSDFDFAEPSTESPLGRQGNVDEESEAQDNGITVETIPIDGSGSGDVRGFRIDELDGVTTEDPYDEGSGSGAGGFLGSRGGDDDEDNVVVTTTETPSTESPVDESADVFGFRNWNEDEDEEPISPPEEDPTPTTEEEPTPTIEEESSPTPLTTEEEETTEQETTTGVPDIVDGGLPIGRMGPSGAVTETPVVEDTTETKETEPIVPVDELTTKEPVLKELETTKAPVLEPDVGRKQVPKSDAELIAPGEKSGGADDARPGEVQAEPKQGSTSTYVCLGILGICLVALIAFVALKRRRAYQGIKRQERRDAENPGTEMLDMDKALLGKPADDDKKNGNSEISPLVSNGEKEPSIVASKFPGNFANGKRENDIPAYKSEIPPLTTFGKEKPAKLDEPQQFYKPIEQPAVINDKNIQKPTEVDSKPATNEEAPKAKAPPLSKQESLNDDVFIPNEDQQNALEVPPRYSPVYSPDTGRVKIKMTSIPDSIPKTPVMVTRSRSNAGDIVITPTPNPKFTKPVN